MKILAGLEYILRKAQVCEHFKCMRMCTYFCTERILCGFL